MEITQRKEKIKWIARPFLVNIGHVIQHYRIRKGWSQSALGNEIGVNNTTISKYERGDIDISASKMAYIAFLLGFEPECYAMPQGPGDKTKKWSQIFKELVTAVEETRRTAPPEQYSEFVKPRYDRTDEHGNIIPTYPIRKPKGERLPGKRVLPPTDTDDELFDKYMDSSWEGKQKVPLLLMAYHTLYASELSDIKDMKAAIRAITRIIASDEDKTTNKMLAEYLKKCQRSE